MQVSLQGMEEEFVGWEKATEMPYCSAYDEHSLGLSPHALTAAPCTVACYIKFLFLYKEKQISTLIQRKPEPC